MGERNGIAAILATHLFDGDGYCEICKVHRMSTKGVQPCAGSSRHTILTFHGETGGDAIGWDPWVCTRFEDDGSPIWERPSAGLCPAPTPEAL